VGALDDYRAKHETVIQSALLFSAHPDELTERVEAARLEHAETKRALTLSRHKLARLTAEHLRGGAQNGLVVHTLAEEDADLLGSLAQELVKYEGVVALLGAVQRDRAQLLFVRHEDGSADMREVLRVALERLGGRGGGSPVRAQGSGRAEGWRRHLKLRRNF
jgi:alanyl-tRNA synthetase